jgi:hypothetical protein
MVQKYNRSARLPERERILNCVIREKWAYRILFWMIYEQKNRIIDKLRTHIADAQVNTIRKEECGKNRN